MTRAERLVALTAEGSRVALVGSDPELVEAATAGVKTLLRFDPAEASVGPLAEARADQVWLCSGWALLPDPAAFLRAVAMAAPEAQLFLLFPNGSSAGALVDRLTEGAPRPEEVTEVQVEVWLSRASLRVKSREGFVRPGTPTVAPRTRDALHALLRQLNPRSSADDLLLRVERGSASELSAPLVRGRLSVLLMQGPSDPPERMGEALFSLAGQDYQPVEVVVVSELPEKQLLPLLAPIAELGKLQLRFVAGVEGATRVATGQYLAFLPSKDVVYPRHYSTLIGALPGSGCAWAVARSRSAFVDALGHITRKGPHSSDRPLCRRELLDPSLPVHSCVIDRDRLGPFAEHLTLPPTDVIGLLAASFQPCSVEGAPTCEVRMAEQALPARGPGDLSCLLSVAELTESLPSSPSPLRYRIADALNQKVQRQLSGTHAFVRSIAGRWMK